MELSIVGCYIKLHNQPEALHMTHITQKWYLFCEKTTMYSNKAAQRKINVSGVVTVSCKMLHLSLLYLAML